MHQRASGILLHPTSLPGPFSCGKLGQNCLDFINFLALSQQSVWQILPLGPTGFGDSPYSGYSAFAGNPLLICPERLAVQGDLTPADLDTWKGTFDRVDYAAANRAADQLMQRGYARFKKTGSDERQTAFGQFCRDQAYWLNDYAIFRALRSHFGDQAWTTWPEELRERRESALKRWGERLAEIILQHKYGQFVFFEQWFEIKRYANRLGISILGDLPIFVAQDSSDVWANQQLFRLETDGNPTVVAGVPPDYFSSTGQRWGNPLYDWQAMETTGFSWWLARFRWNLQLADQLRIDHFRGFAACWEIPATEPTAINGQWQTVPGERLFRLLQEQFAHLPLIAEDLGVITDDVVALRKRFELPGMKILQFAFDSGPDNPYLPHNIEADSIVYTGTHDNNTTLGWWQALKTAQKRQVRNYLGHSCKSMPMDLIRCALQSVAGLSILPLQDLLSLDGSARMNTPGEALGNWSWRYAADQLQTALAEALAQATHTYGRSPAVKGQI